MYILTLDLIVTVNALLIIVLLPRATLTTGELLEPLKDESFEDISLIVERSHLVYTDSDDLFSSPEPIDLDSIGPFSNTDLVEGGGNTNLFGEDDGGTLWANKASSQSACVSQADESSSLFTRDDDRSCQIDNAATLSPDEIQFLQDPLRSLNNLLPPTGNSGSSESSDPEFRYKGLLSDEEARAKEGNSAAMEWKMEDIPGVEEIFQPQDFECRDIFRPFPVCCDGPRFSEPGWGYAGIENCDVGTFHCKTILN